MSGTTFVPLEYDVFAGLDVDKRSIAVTFSDHQGFIRSLRIPYKVDHLVNYVRKHFPERKVAFAYEAGPTGYGLYDGLSEGAYSCLVVAPSMIPKAPAQRVKTNRLDSRRLSENLRGGQLQGIHVPSQRYRELRHLTQLRDTYVSQATASKQRIKALLLFEGIEFPPAPRGSEWSSKVKAELRALQCSSTVRFKLAQLLDTLEFAEKQVLTTTREIRRFLPPGQGNIAVPAIHDEHSRDRLGDGKPAVGPDRGLARAQERPSIGRFCGSGSQRELHRRAQRSGTDHTDRPRSTEK